MITFVPFAPDHLDHLTLQAAQRCFERELANQEYRRALVVPDFSWTGIIGGRVVGCAGLVPQWPGRAIAWALLGEIPRPAWPAVHKKVLAVLAAAERRGFFRIETHVDPQFPQAMRWVAMLGFRPEGLNRAYTPDRRDLLMTARIAA